MKQTKPFGRAYLPVTAAAGAQSVESPAPQAAMGQDQQGAASADRTDLFRLSSTGPSMYSPVAVAPWRHTVTEYCVMALTLVGLLSGYVLMRDSVALSNLLQQVTTEETVMICKDGKMVYPDYSVMDRLLNKGRFLCTEWSVQRGFLTLPRRR